MKCRSIYTIALLLGYLCIIGLLQPISAQDRGGRNPSNILIGAWYFGGWWRSPMPAHYFNEGIDWRLKHPEREPVTGWYNDKQEIVDEEISLASKNGLDFFCFDWYSDRETPFAGSREHINEPLDFFVNSKNKSWMRFALLYVNEPRFAISSDAEWNSVADKWISYFRDPQYLKIDNRPVIIIISISNMRQAFGGAAGARRALTQLRQKAISAGFPNILIGGGLPQPGPKSTWAKNLPADGYDFLTQYNIPIRTFLPEPTPYSSVISYSPQLWREFAATGSVPFIPAVLSGHDSFQEKPGNTVRFVDRSPELFGKVLYNAKLAVERNSNLHLANGTRIVIINAWNELGEGGYIIPTMSEGDAYLKQIKQVFSR
jgi:hypothetical protein